MSRRITILGMGISGVRKADSIEAFVEGTEVWSMNNSYLTYPSLFEKRGFDRMYEIHAWEYLKRWEPGPGIDHFAHLEACGCDVVTTQPIPVVRRQVDLPVIDVLRAFGRNVEIKGTPSWMLAHALLEHAQGNTIEYIQSFGIDTRDPSHATQRPSWAQWCVRAEAMGVQLGGTMTAFREEPDLDEGLHGLIDQARHYFDQLNTQTQQDKEEE
jgi:hypothetical protein